MAQSVGRVREPGPVLGGVGTDQFEHAADLRIGGARHRQPSSVGGRVHVARDRAGYAAPGARRRWIARRPRHHRGAEERQDRLEHAHVDELAGAAVGVAPVERGEHAADPGDRAHHVAHRHRREHRGSVGVAGHVREPGVGLGQRAIAGTVGVGPVDPEARHRHHDRARVPRRDVRVGATPPGEDLRGLVHHHDVGHRGETLHEVDAFGGVEVDPHRPLVAPRQRPHVRAVAVHLADEPQRIAACRFHLHDVGPEVAQHRRQQGRREEGGEIQHPHARQRGWGSRGRVSRGRRCGGGGSRGVAHRDAPDGLARMRRTYNPAPDGSPGARPLRPGLREVGLSGTRTRIGLGSFGEVELWDCSTAR